MTCDTPAGAEETEQIAVQDPPHGELLTWLYTSRVRVGGPLLETSFLFILFLESEWFCEYCMQKYEFHLMRLLLIHLSYRMPSTCLKARQKVPNPSQGQLFIRIHERDS